MALLLCISFALPYIAPKSFPLLSILSLTVSPLLLVNVLFVLYWLLQLKRQFLLSGILLGISTIVFSPFYVFSSNDDATKYQNAIKVLTYNVRLFNAYQKDVEPTKVAQELQSILTTENPDVFFFQEYDKKSQLTFDKYPYKYIHFKNENHRLGQAIYSKYPLINTGAFDFDQTQNNTLFADVVKGKDTLRLYNLHLKSIGIVPTVDPSKQVTKERFFKRLKAAFVSQQEQASLINEHKSKSKYPIILAGDFNNTAFSYVYKSLRKEMQDAFIESGSGLGTTFQFDMYPLRIDYIFTSTIFNVVEFKTIEQTFSDHHAIVATLGWNTLE